MEHVILCNSCKRMKPIETDHFVEKILRKSGPLIIAAGRRQHPLFASHHGFSQVKSHPRIPHFNGLHLKGGMVVKDRQNQPKNG